MQYRRFGKTNLQLSVFSLGLMRGLQSEEGIKQSIDSALRYGINHLETAPAYGKSEAYLGLALQTLKEEQLYLTTKVLPTLQGDGLEKSIDASLSRLGVNSIDCLAIHGINTDEHLQSIIHHWKIIEKLLDDRRIKHIGFSTHGSLDLILKTINTDLFEFVNLHYYYFFQRNQPVIELASQKDMGIFIISPGDKGGRLYSPPEKLKQFCFPYSPLHLTYRFLLSDPRITTLSLGVDKPEELDYPLQVCDQVTPLSLEEKAIFLKLESELKNTLKTDLCQQCYYCLPCPEIINIPEILRLRNLTLAYDMKDYGQYRYRMLENAGHWFWGKKGHRCTECGDCLPKCPSQLNIPELLRDTHERLNGADRRRLWDD